MKFLIGICLLSLTVSVFGHRIGRETDPGSMDEDTYRKYMISTFKEMAHKNLDHMCSNADHVTDFKHDFDNFVDCAALVFDPVEVEHKVIQLRNSSETLDHFMTDVIENYCPKSLVSCFEDLKSNLGNCFSSQGEVDGVVTILKSIKHFKDFACHNHGEHITQFLHDGGVDCLKDVQHDLRQCNQASNEKHGEKKLDERFTITKQSCDQLDDLHKCYSHTFETTCAHKSISVLFNELYNEISPEFGCDKFENVV